MSWRKAVNDNILNDESKLRMSSEQGWNLKRLLEWTSDYFAKNNVESSRLCAEILLSHCLNCQRIELYTRFDYNPPESELGRYRELVKRCAAHEPVAYLVGYKEFYSMKFKVNSSVLIPRPETEVLVAQAIDFLNGHNRPKADCLDLCCGSGCIGISIAANVVESEFISSDISEEALGITSENAEAYELGSRLKVCKSNMFEDIESSGKGIFDLIVSNPPYISDEEFTRLEKNVADYEPHLALKAGDNGLEFYKILTSQAGDFLADDGMLMLEVGYDQGPAVSELLSQAGCFTDITMVKDSLGHNRVVKAKKCN